STAAAGPVRRRGGGPPAPASAGDAPGRWNEVTAHLGVRFEPGYKGPGLKVRDVIPDGPADRKKSHIVPGEVILTIDGASVDPSMDLTEVLNGPLARDIRLTVQAKDGGDTRPLTIRP